MKRIHVLALSFLVPLHCFGSGVVNLHGKLTSITETEFVIQTGRTLYTVKKTAIPPHEAKKLTHTEVEISSLSVPMDAIESIRTASQ